MNNRKLLILGIVAVGMAGLTILQRLHISRPSAGPSQAGSYLIQGLDTGAIAQIVIGTGQDAVRLVRQQQDGRFVVANKDNYPAVTSKINNLLTSCLDIRTLELITGDAANHNELQVTEEKARTVVKFLNENGAVITGIIVGKIEAETESTYIRLVDSNNVYSVKESPRIQSSALDCVDKDIVNFNRSEIARVAVTGPEESYTLKIADGNNERIELENPPEGMKLKQNEAGEVFSALSYLSFNDVKKESAESDNLKFDNAYEGELKNSTVYAFRIARSGDRAYLKCRADYVGQTGDILGSDEELKDKEAKLLAQDRAADFTRKHQGWVYEIADWKAKNFTRKLSELLEEQKQQPPPEPNEVSSADEVNKAKPKEQE